MSTCIKTEWKTVTVAPERLRSGLWGYEEGDIAASYSADVYTEHKRLRRHFNHDFAPFVVMATHRYGLDKKEARAYPILHHSYAGEIMSEYRDCGLHDHYVGKAVRRFGRDCIFGLPVIFRQRDLRKAEIIDLCRRMYAFGGLFAVKAGSYNALIETWLKRYPSSKLAKIFAQEIEANLPQSQMGMREWIQASAFSETTEKQLSLL